MNKLTTIKTITKAAPLALLAVVLSGSAFARHNDDHVPGPKNDKPQPSVEVVTSCSLCGSPGADGYDPRDYINCDYDESDPTLFVSATITDETGDVVTPIVLELDVDATATRKGRGPMWHTILPAEPIAGPSGDGTWDAQLKLCQLDPTIDGAKAASAIVSVVVLNPDASKSVYSSRCENFDPDPETDEDEDGIDQSNFDISELMIDCPDP